MDLDDTSIPGMEEAIELARKLRYHCTTHKFPKEIEIYGVLVFGDIMLKKSNSYSERMYIKGKEYEKDRIATLLGLSPST